MTPKITIHIDGEPFAPLDGPDITPISFILLTFIKQHQDERDTLNPARFFENFENWFIGLWKSRDDGDYFTDYLKQMKEDHLNLFDRAFYQVADHFRSHTIFEANNFDHIREVIQLVLKANVTFNSTLNEAPEPIEKFNIRGVRNKIRSRFSRIQEWTERRSRKELHLKYESGGSEKKKPNLQSIIDRKRLSESLRTLETATHQESQLSETNFSKEVSVLGRWIDQNIDADNIGEIYNSFQQTIDKAAKALNIESIRLTDYLRDFSKDRLNKILTQGRILNL